MAWRASLGPFGVPALAPWPPEPLALSAGEQVREAPHDRQAAALEPKLSLHPDVLVIDLRKADELATHLRAHGV